MNIQPVRNRNLTQKILRSFPQTKTLNIHPFQNKIIQSTQPDWSPTDTRTMKAWIRGQSETPSAHLIERAKLWRNPKDGFGWILWTIQKNHLSGLKHLVQAGFDIQARDILGFNGLWHAHSSEMINYLFENGLHCHYQLHYSDFYSNHLLNQENFLALTEYYFRYSYFLVKAGHPLFVKRHSEELEAFLNYLPSLGLEQWINPQPLHLRANSHVQPVSNPNTLQSNFWAALFFNLIQESRHQSISSFLNRFFETLSHHLSIRTLPLNSQGLTLEKSVAIWLEGGRVCFFDSNVIAGGIHGPNVPLKNLSVSTSFVLHVLSALLKEGLDLKSNWAGQCQHHLTWEDALQRFLPNLGHEGQAYLSSLQSQTFKKIIPNPLFQSKKSTRL